MENNKKYFAFISYKREDEAWAKWLQHKLEHYRLPSNLNGRTDLPKEIRPIFRDKSDLAGGVLADEINNALENSQYLIVICSPRAAQSEWVGKEVQTFIELGRTEKIIPFIVGGTAFSQNPEDECFPKALRELPSEQELLGVNINEMGRDAAAVKVVAQMFGLKFDKLWQRWEREKRRRRILKTMAIIFVFFAIAWIYVQRQQYIQAEWGRQEERSRLIAKKAQELVDNGDSYTARRMLLDVLPHNVANPDKPLTKEAKKVLTYACQFNSAILKGHESSVYSVCYSGDGKYIASASLDGVVNIWDASNGDLIQSIKDHGWKMSACFSPDDKYLVYASSAIVIYDIASKKAIHIFFGHGNHINTISFSPDGKYMVSASYDNKINIYDFSVNHFEDDNPIKTLLGHSKSVTSASYSPDGRFILSSSWDGSIIIWDAKTGYPVSKKECCSDGVDFACYSPDGKRIAVAAGDSITIRDANTLEILNTLKDETMWEVGCVNYSPDGFSLVSASGDNVVRIWRASDGVLLKTYKGHSQAIKSACFSPDSRQIATASEDETVRMWAVCGGNLINTIDNNIDNKEYNDVLAACYDPKGRYIASASEDNLVKIWDAATGRLLETLVGHTDEVRSVDYNPNGCRIVSTSYNEMIIWDAKHGELLQNKPFGGIFNDNYVNYACFSPDGSRIAAAMGDGTVQIFNSKDCELVKVFRGHEKSVNYVCFSPDGKLIASASDDKTVIIWDAETAEPIKVYWDHFAEVFSVVFSQDGHHFMSTSYDRTIIIRDMNYENSLLRLNDYSNNIINGFRYAMYSPDNQYIISTSNNGTIGVWDADMGDLLYILEGHRSRVNTVDVSPDNRRIVSASDDGTIRIWDFPPLQELIDRTRERFKDNPLTPDERKMYYLE